MVQTAAQADTPSTKAAQFEAQFDMPPVKATKKVRQPKANGEPVLDLAALEEKLAISFDVQLPDPEAPTTFSNKSNWHGKYAIG